MPDIQPQYEERPHTTANKMTIIKTPKMHMPITQRQYNIKTPKKHITQTYPHTIAKTPKYYTIAKIPKHHTIAKTHKHYNNHMDFKHHNNHFKLSQTSFTPMSPFHRPGRTPMTPSTHPNYSDMGHELSYGSVSLHTQDFLE